MAYQALYRKYRPDSFENVYGQDVIIKTLKNIIIKEKLNHAYLFTGPRGTGKTSTAKLFAKTINCLNNASGISCNTCDTCSNYLSNPDIIEIDAASNNGVDEIREIRNKVNLVPSMSKYKVYIIDEVHMLSISAFNALLKTLEEPPKHIIFILATTEPQKLPSTVISRCQRFDFKNINSEAMKQCLTNICSQEKIEIDLEALNEIVLNSKGGMRDAINLLDQASIFCEGKIIQKDIEDLTGNISKEEIASIINNIIFGETKKILEMFNDYEKNGKDFVKMTEKISNYLRNELIKIKMDANYKTNIPLLKIYKLIKFFNELLEKTVNYKYSKILLETSLIEYMDNNISKQESSDVPRETLQQEKTDIFLKPSNQEKLNVPRETLIEKILIDLKKARINNTLMNSSKKELNFIIELWNNLDDYLLDKKYRKTAGILKNAVPVAATKKEVLITVPTESVLKEIEEEYDVSKKIIEKIYNNEYKITYITKNYWQQERPIFAKKFKNKELVEQDEEKILQRLKEEKRKINSTNEFVDLIELEEK